MRSADLFFSFIDMVIILQHAFTFLQINTGTHIFNKNSDKTDNQLYRGSESVSSQDKHCYDGAVAWRSAASQPRPAD